MEINLQTSKDQKAFEKVLLKNYPTHSIELTIEVSVALSETGNQQTRQNIHNIKINSIPLSSTGQESPRASAAGEPGTSPSWEDSVQ